MILIVENDPQLRLEAQTRLYKLGLITCGTSARYAENAFAKHHVSAVYLPYAESLKNPVGFCRKIKMAHPGIPLVAAVPREGFTRLYELYAVTDNIPLRPIATIRVAEILCELLRLTTGRDYADCRVGAELSVSIYDHIVHVRGKPITVTTHELSILRYLAEEYPRRVSAEELAVVTGTPGGRRKPSSIRTQIAKLNARALECSYAPIISKAYAKGYSIEA